jgi:hypothetical protein
LFREGREVVVVDEVEAFEGTSGGESPAGTTLTLVFDGGNGTLGGPVNGSGPGRESVGVGGSDVGGVEVFASEEAGFAGVFLEFLVGEIREFGDTDFVEVAFSVGGGDPVEGGGENLEAFLFFFEGEVVLVVFETELVEKFALGVH